jgi:TatD DNase family protein
MLNNKIVDSHCHLNLSPLSNNTEYFIEKAQDLGVCILNTICTQISDIPQLLNLVKHECVFASVGIHPNNASVKEFLTCTQIENFLKSNEKFIGIGETGLDYYKYEEANKEIQKKSFIEHINAAQITGAPIIIHARGAEYDIMDILNIEFKNAPFKGVFHCFTGTKELAKFALDNNFYISFSGIVTFNNAHNVQDMVKYVPLESMLIETDAPYLAPHPFRGKPNEPAFVTHVVETISLIKGISSQEVAKFTSENFLDLFKNSSLEAYYNKVFS